MRLSHLLLQDLRHFKPWNLHQISPNFWVIAPAAVPELQKLLTFQHGNEGVGAMLALNDRERSAADTCKRQRRSRLTRASRSLRQSHKYVRQNLAVGDGVTGLRVLQILNGLVYHELVDI
jgi:hypothetical protein